MLTFGLVQCDIIADDISRNLQYYDDFLQERMTQHVDLLVFPEMFSSGFSENVVENAEKDNGGSIRYLKSVSRKYDCDVVATLPIIKDNFLYNKLLWISSENVVGEYDKHNLFLGEEKYFTPGTTKIVVERFGYRFMPLICFDVRFPEWSRNFLTDNKFYYDCLIYVANFPSPRESELIALAKARAIENQSYVIVVNRTGTDGFGRNYSGGSGIINPHGEIESSLPEGQSGILLHSCDFSSINLLRREFPVSKYW